MALSVTLRFWGYSLPVAKSFGLIALKGFFNQGVSGSGLLAQGLRARYRLGISWQHFGAATLVQAASLLGVLGTLLTILSVALLSGLQQTLVIVAGVAAVCAPFALVLLWRVLPHQAIRRFINRWPDDLGISAVSRRGLVWGLLGLIAAQLLFVSFRFARIAIIAVLMQPDISLAHLFLVVVLADLVTIVPVTPGGIGVRELVIALGGAAVGGLEIALAAAIIDRVISICLSLIHGLLVLGWYYASDSRAARHQAE